MRTRITTEEFAALLRVNPSTVRRRARKYGIEPEIEAWSSGHGSYKRNYKRFWWTISFTMVEMMTPAKKMKRDLKGLNT